MRSWPAIAILLAVSVLTSQTTKAELIGVIFAFDDSEVFSINEMTGQDTLIGPSGLPGLNSLARNGRGEILSAAKSAPGILGSDTDRLVQIDPVTGLVTAATKLIGSRLFGITALAFSSNLLFGIDRFALPGPDSYDVLVKIDTATGVVTDAGTLVGTSGLQALDSSPAGTLYGWDALGPGLVIIDPIELTVTDVNPDVDGGPEIQSIAFSPDGTLFGGSTELYRIDVSSGVLTQIDNSSLADVRGLVYIPEPSTLICIFGFGGCLRCFRGLSNSIKPRSDLTPPTPAPASPQSPLPVRCGPGTVPLWRCCCGPAAC